MLIRQTTILCLALCIFSFQTEYSFGESSDSENPHHSITLDDRWEEYGCKKLEKPFAKLELCLGTIVNQLILRILQNYIPTPLPEHLIIVDGKKGFESQIRKYIKTHLPHVFVDRIKLERIFDQINEYLFKPLIKYMDQFPMDTPEPEERALIDSRREEIGNILKKYMKEPLNPVVPVTGSSFEENLPALIRYLMRYAPDLTENFDVLPSLLHQIKKYGFKEIDGRDLSKLPKKEYDRIVSKVGNIINQYKKPSDSYDVVLPSFIHDFSSFKRWLSRHFETYVPDLFVNKPLFENVLKQVEELFDGTEAPKNSTTDNINGLDKNVLLQFVQKYYPEQFGNQDFINELVQNYEQQSKLNVLPTSAPSNDQIRNALMYFFNKVYPKLSIDEQFVKQFTEDFKPDYRNHEELSVEVPESETISPTRAEILEYVKNQVIKGIDPNETYKISNGNFGQNNLNVAATSPVPEVELISVPSRRVLAEVMTEEPSEELESSEIDPTIIISPPSAVEFVLQDPTPAEQKTIRQKILECIKESFPHIYANKPVLREILKQLEDNILSGTDTPPLSLETQIRRFSKEHVPKITVEQSGTVQSSPEEKVIQVEISPANEEQQKIVEQVYIVKGDTQDAEPTVSVVRPKEEFIAIGIKPEKKHPRDTVENVYIVEGNDRVGSVSLSNEKPNQDAFASVQVSSDSSHKPNKQLPIKVQHNIKTKSNNEFAKASKDEINRYRKEFMMVLKKFQENALRDKEHKIEMPKVKHMKGFGKREPTTGTYNDRFKEYFTARNTEKLAAIQFPYEHHFLPLLIRSYGPLYEKEHGGESLTKDEHLKMKLLEKIFANNQQFRELYLKKFGPQDKFDIKSMLYNMYKMELKENEGKPIQIDPMKNVKFLRVDPPKLEYVRDENDKKQIETI